MKTYSRRELYAAGEFLGDSVTREECGRRVMGGGGGGTSITMQNVPDELKPLATGYTNRAINLANQSYEPFAGQRFADLNQSQQLGLGMMQDRALNGPNTLGNAEGALNQMISGQSNPYLDAMVNKAQANVLGNARAADVRSGSFGNTGVAEMAARQMGEVATNMYGQAYESDAGRRMQAIGMAPQINQAGYAPGETLFKAGQVQQDQQQQGLDFNYGQFQESQNLPYKQLAAMAGVFNSGLGGTTTQQDGGGK